MDPADLVAKVGVDAWREAVRNSRHIILFVLERALRESKDERAAARQIKEKVLPYVAALDSSIEKAHFIKNISDESGIPIEALKEDLKKVEEESRKKAGNIEEEKSTEEGEIHYRRDHILRRMLGVVLWQRSLEKKILNVEEIINRLSEILGESEEQILKRIEGKEEDLIFEAETFYGVVENSEKDMKELLRNLEEEHLKEKLFKKMRELTEAELSKDQDKLKVILKEINDINKKIEAIKNNDLKK